jgi:hypothetical protein
MFEEIDKAYLASASGIQIFELTNGLSYVLGAENSPDISTEAKEMRLIYNRKGI